MKQYKTINTTLKATLSVATAITAATSLPAGIIQQVQALDNTNNPITVPQTTTEPTRKTELANELKQKDTELLSAFTALKGAMDTKKLAETSVINADKDVKDNNDIISTTENTIDTTLKNEYTPRENEKNEAKASLDTLNKQKDDLNISIKQKQAEADEQFKIATDAVNKVNDLYDAYSEAKNNIENVTQSKEESENKVKTLDNEINELDTQIANKNADLNNVIDTLQDKNYTVQNKAKYQEEIDTAKDSINKHTTELNSKQSQLESNKQNQAAYYEEYENLRGKSSRTAEEESRMTSLFMKISNLDVTINALKFSINKLNNEISSLNDTINTATQEITKLDEIEKITAEITDKTTTKNKKQQERDAEQKNVDNCTNKINEYNSVISDYNDAFSKNAQEVMNYQEKLNALNIEKDNLNELEPKIEAAEQVFNEKNTRFSNIETAISQWNDIKAKYSNNSVSLKTAIQNATPFGPFVDDKTLTDLIETVNDYIEAQENVAVLKQKLRDANIVLATAVSNLSNAQKDYDDALDAYNNAKDNYDLFVQTHGNITEETITTIETSKYTGKEIKPAVVVKDSFGNTVDASEYLVAYSSNTEPGIATITITMDGVNYVGQFVKTFKIYGYITEDTITTIESSKYTANPIEPDIIVKDNQGNVIDESEYTVAYENNKEPGIAAVKVTMNGIKYDGTFTKNFRIYGYISEDTITTIEASKYTGKEIKPSVVVKDNLGDIVDNSEYTVTYEDNKEPGIATVKIKMNGNNYDGEFTKTFKIYNYVTENTVSTIESSKYTGKEIKPNVIVKDNLGNIIDESEYTVTYENNIEPGTASVKVKMNGEKYDGEFTKIFKIYGYVTENTVSTIESSKYTGKEVKPDVIVKDNLGNIIDESEYTITYENNIEPGTASVKVKMNGEKYDGEFTKKFEIIKDLVPEKNNVVNKNKEVKIKTGDDASLVGFSLLTMLSSIFYFFIRNKKEEQ